jgi:ribosome-associated protein
MTTPKRKTTKAAPRKKAPAKTAAKAGPKAAAKPAPKSAPKAALPNTAAVALLKLVVQALDAKKAESLCVLDVSQQSSITDYLVLANGNSEPHLRALRVELEKVIDAQQVRILGMDTGHSSGWLVIDAFDVMVHLFTPENRDKYRMETLWKDATELPLAKLLK